jgi:S-adenosylmethionine/arginine decarboxylase-like enzyme
MIKLYDEFYEKTSLKNKIEINPFKDKNHLNKILNKIIEIKNINKLNNEDRKKEIY